jgi:hypothetical protein
MSSTSSKPTTTLTKNAENEEKKLFNKASSISDKIHKVNNLVINTTKLPEGKPKNRKSKLSKLGNSASSALGSVASGIGSVGTAVASGIGSVGTAVASGIGKVASGIGSVGKDIGTGIGTGIDKTKNKIKTLAAWLEMNKKKNIKSFEKIKDLKNINQYIKKDFIYIDITNLLGETFITTTTINADCFKNNILLKTIAYSLTSNNERDKTRIIYFKKGTELYVYNTKEYKSYKKMI